MTPLLALLLAAAPAQPTALERLAADVTATFASQRFEAPVGVYVEGGSAPLSRAFATVLMARLAERALAPVPITAKDASDAEQVARNDGARSLLRLTLAWEAPRLVARGDALSTWVNFWSGQVATRSGPGVAVVAAADADLDALTFLGAPAPAPGRPLQLDAAVLARLPTVPAALAVGDLDGDRRAEVVALVNDALVVWGADGAVRARAELSLPVSRRPTREPFGLIGLQPGRVQVFSGRRERVELFSFGKDGLKSAGAAETVTTGALQLSPRAGLPGFAPALSWGGKPVTLAFPPQHLAPFGTLALAVNADATAAVLRGQASPARVSGVGCGSALGDLDADGTPEVAVTTPRTAGDADELRVLALGAFESTQARSGALHEAPTLAQRKLEGRAVVLAAGDLDADGSDELVLGLWRSDGTGELLLLRRAP